VQKSGDKPALPTLSFLDCSISDMLNSFPERITSQLELAQGREGGLPPLLAAYL